MSRCFLFPPPGFEKKAKLDDSHSLKKEKDKEKKRKREEKDKRKDRSDKEKRKEKHREKKERKKHKDSTDKDKDESKNKLSEEKKPNGLLDSFNGQDPKFVQELGRRICDGDQATGNQMVQKILFSDQKTCQLPENKANGHGDEAEGDGPTHSAAQNKPREMQSRRVDGTSKPIEIDGPKSSVTQSESWMENRRLEGTSRLVESNNVQGKDKAKEKFDRAKRKEEKAKRRDQELDSRICDGDQVTGSQMVQKILFGDQKTRRLPENKANGLGDEAEGDGPTHPAAQNKPREMESRRVDGTSSKPMEIDGPKSPVIQSESWMEKKRLEGTSRLVESNNVQGKDKAKEEMVDRAKRKEEKSKRREERAKRKEEKAKRKEVKARKRVEKAREKAEKLKDVKVLNQMPPPLEESNQNFTVDRSKNPFPLSSEHRLLGKQKALVMNGNLHGNEKLKDVKGLNQTRPPLEESNQNFTVDSSKNSFPLSSVHRLPGKQKALEMNGNLHGNEKLKDVKGLNQTRPPLDKSNQNFTVDSSKTPFPLSSVPRLLGKQKALEMNGNLHGNEIQPSKFPRPISASNLVTEKSSNSIKGNVINSLKNAQQSADPSTVDSKASTSARPPHPDSKYLDDILSVPRMGSPGFDDQEWLFGVRNLESRTSNPGFGKDGVPEVWARALRIESADITALPYVLPY